MLEHALDALRRGFWVHPCRPKTKEPAFIRGIFEHGIKDATQDEAMVRRCWKDDPDYNPGVNAGTCIDCDTGLKSGEEALAWAKDVGLPPTLTVHTGRLSSYGVQFHFSGKAKKNGPYECKGVEGEFRLQNSLYGMGPGAIHPTGGRYEIILDLPIAPWPSNSYIEECALKTIKKLTKPLTEYKPGEKIKKSQRQYWLVAQCSRLRKTGLTGDPLFAALRALCNQHCEAPEEKTDEMLKQIVESGERLYQMDPPTTLAWFRELIADKGQECPPLEELAEKAATLSSVEYAEIRLPLAKRRRAAAKDLDRETAKRRPVKNADNSILVAPGNLEGIIRRSEETLHGMGLKYFERIGELVNICHGRDLPDIKNIERSADSVVIQQASYETIFRDLDARAKYHEISTVSLQPYPVNVPRNLPGQLRDRVRSAPREVPYPSLDLVTGSPVLLPSGKVSSKIFEEGVLYVPRDWKLYPPVPDCPKLADAQKALKHFDHVFSKFPFVDPGQAADWDATASYSVALSGVLSLVARPYLGLNAIPIHAAGAPTQRTGKTKMIDAVSGAALGHKATTAHFSDEEELGKHLQPLMRAGDRAILLDNIERTLQSAKLCSLVTGGVLRDRVLGESRDVELRNYAVIFATGNNLTIGGDLASRSLRADIDADVERPESRVFSFDPVARAIECHPQLVVAALIALRAFILAGMPWTPKRAKWGGFEKYDAIVCGCLTWCGYADPVDTRERILQDDPVLQGNVDILTTWFETYGCELVSLYRIKNDKGEIYEALLKEGRWDGYYARWVLKRLKGRIYGGLKLRQALSLRSTYIVEKVPPKDDF